MKEYFIALFLVSCVAAIVKAVGNDGATKKYIEMICALCVISAVIIPILGVNADMSDIISFFDEIVGVEQNYDEIYNKYLLEEGVSAAEDRMSADVCQRLSVGEEAIKLRLVLAEDGSCVVGAKAYITNAALAADPSEVRGYVREVLGIECEIIYDIFDE